jgi:uncharacterized protein
MPQPASPSASCPSCQTLGLTMLLQVKGSRTFLADSIHSLPAGSVLPEALWEVQRSASQVLFETDLDHSPGMPASATLGPQSPLSSLVPVETFAAATVLWSQFGIQLSLESVKPWFAGLVLANSLSGTLAFDRACGVDRQIWNATPAERRGVLEGTEALEAFDRAPVTEQAAYLDMIARTPEVVIARFVRLCQYWQTSNDTGFQQELLQIKQRFPVMFSGLIDQRNRKWLPAIIELVKRSEPSLVLVGALHLVGQSGIPALLAQHGFSVSAA